MRRQLRVRHLPSGVRGRRVHERAAPVHPRVRSVIVIELGASQATRYLLPRHRKGQSGDAWSGKGWPSIISVVLCTGSRY